MRPGSENHVQRLDSLRDQRVLKLLPGQSALARQRRCPGRSRRRKVVEKLTSIHNVFLAGVLDEGFFHDWVADVRVLDFLDEVVGEGVLETAVVVVQSKTLFKTKVKL